MISDMSSFHCLISMWVSIREVYRHLCAHPPALVTIGITTELGFTDLAVLEIRLGTPSIAVE